jgi:hypothetical protein
MSERLWNYYDVRAALSPDIDSDLIEHIESHFPSQMKMVEVVRLLIRCHMKVVATVGSPDNLEGYKPPWAIEVLRRLDNIKVVAANGGDVEEAIEEVKGGLKFEGDDFFGDE